MVLANVFAPMGFRSDSQRTLMKTVTRPIIQPRVPIGAAASADIAIGDAYGIDANGDAYHAGADAVVRGICMGFELQAISGVMNSQGPLSIDYASSTTAVSMIGCEDPSVEFDVWSDNVVGAQQANVGGTFNLGDQAPDSLFGQSRQYLNINGGPGAQFKMIKITQETADNSVGAACRVLVQLAQAI